MGFDLGKFVIIQPGAAQLLMFHVKPQRFDQVQLHAGIGAEADDIAGVGRNFRFKQDNMEHGEAWMSGCVGWSG